MQRLSVLTGVLQDNGEEDPRAGPRDRVQGESDVESLL